jgi:hypothetical protein
MQSVCKLTHPSRAAKVDQRLAVLRQAQHVAWLPVIVCPPQSMHPCTAAAEVAALAATQRALQLLSLQSHVAAIAVVRRGSGMLDATTDSATATATGAVCAISSLGL